MVFASDPFEIQCGVSQCDPLLPYLLTIALEVINIAIREDGETEGMKVRKFQVKINIFAFDRTTFVINGRSFVKLKNLLSMFGNISGLKLNDEKTEACWLGSSHDALGMNKVNKPIKILGIIFTYDWKLCI